MGGVDIGGVSIINAPQQNGNYNRDLVNLPPSHFSSPLALE